MPCDDCLPLQRENDALRIDVENWQTEHTAILRRLQRAEAAAKRPEGARGHSQRDVALYNLWLEVTKRDPARVRFTKDRQDAILNMRRAGWEDKHMAAVIRTGAKFPFLVFGRWSATGSKSDLKNDLTDFFKSGARFESLLALADADA